MIQPQTYILKHSPPTIVFETLKKLMKVGQVCTLIFTSHQDVINVDKGKIQALANSVHQSLKSLCSFFESERHPEEFVEAERGDDGGLWDVLSSDWDLMIPDRF